MKASPPLPEGIDDSPSVRTANHLHSSAIHLLRWVRTTDRDVGVSPERLAILSVLAYAGPKTMSELAELEMVSVPAISRIVKGLEQEGLVTRRRRPDDRRFVRVRVSSAGKRLIEHARMRRLERIAAVLDGLADEELAVLEAATRLIQRLEASSGHREGR